MRLPNSLRDKFDLNNIERLFQKQLDWCALCNTCVVNIAGDSHCDTPTISEIRLVSRMVSLIPLAIVAGQPGITALQPI